MTGLTPMPTLINRLFSLKQLLWQKLLVILVFTGVATLASAQLQTIDKIVVIVDGEVILQSEVDVRTTMALEQIAERNLPPPPEDELKEQIIDALILESLQMQMAYNAGIRVDDNMLNETMNAIAQQNSMDFNQFRQILEQQGMYNVTREQVRKDIVLQQLQGSAVNQRINITRQEVENYLRSESGISDIAPEYRIAHVFISSTAEDDVVRHAELADLIYKKLESGEGNIIQMAQNKTISGIEVSGGEIAWSKAEGLPDIFSDVVVGLEPGEIAKPFSSPGGYHVVQLMETRGGASMKVNQAHVRHILIAPNEIRTEAQAETLVHELHLRIVDGEDFGDIARQNTDDYNSIVAGGDLDWVQDTQLPADYMAVVHATEIGEMSEPFRVESGWHIIEVLERRVEDVTEDNKRYQAQMILRERKFENELQNWLTEIRDMAYIDIKE